MKAAAKSLLVFAVLAVAVSNPSFAAEPADTVAINGKIYTVNPKQPWAEAIAIKGDTIVYVGGNEGAKAFIGKNTEFRSYWIRHLAGDQRQCGIKRMSCGKTAIGNIQGLWQLH